MIYNKKGKWVNGSIGKIVFIDEDNLKVKINKKTYDVDKKKWEKKKYYLDDENKIKEKVIGTFYQYPIKIAWAITIHKSQGQNLKKVIIDLDTGAFATGQLYVALSRCTIYKGIYLRTPIIRNDVKCDYRIAEYLNNQPFSTLIIVVPSSAGILIIFLLGKKKIVQREQGILGIVLTFLFFILFIKV